MPPRKNPSKARRGKRPQAPPPPLAPSVDWKRPLRLTLGLGLAFGIGLIAGTRQGWVEGHHSMKGENQRWQVRELEDGKIVKHGLFKECYPSSRIVKIQGDYFMDQKHGAWIEYHKNGKIKSRSVYLGGALEAGAEEWDEDGRRAVKKARF